jgi:hypothetical protein
MMHWEFEVHGKRIGLVFGVFAYPGLEEACYGQ